MHSVRRLSTFILSFCLILIEVSFMSMMAAAQVPTGNSDTAYVQLRELKIGDEALLLDNVVLKRDLGTFTFRSGTMYFAAPVMGKVTGAVFVGDGSLVLTPEAAQERRSLQILTKGANFDERFEIAVFRFTDGTYDELKQQAKPAPNPANSDRAANAFKDHLQTMRDDLIARYNISARILQDLMAGNGGYFAAFIRGKNYSDREEFVIDPQGVTAWGLQPEEVAFVTYELDKYGLWLSSHLRNEYANGTAKGNQANGPVDLVSEDLDIELRKSGEMAVTASTVIASAREGLRVVPFSLFRNFKINSVTDANGAPLPYVFEKRGWKDNESDDPDNFNVILPAPLAKGAQLNLKINYEGKQAVSNEGSGNYFPVARNDWFPSTRWGDYCEFQITFRIPKGMKIAATGTLLSDKNEGDWNITEWKTEAPISVAGFNFGRFKMTESKSKSGFLITSFANEEPPDWVKGLLHYANDNLPSIIHSSTTAALGTMDTTTMMKKPQAEGELAWSLYTDYFGPLSFRRLSITQQTACNFGQAWPGVIWLPICSFFDSTVRHQLGVDDTRQPYWSVVAPHEIAHEWWGHGVGWASYRDQWMSEGFAQFSASIFAQAFYSKSDKDLYHRIWETQQRALQEKNRFGFRPIDVGPLTMGTRVDSTKAGSLYSTLIYGKGSFVLHMIRMMMWEPGTGDQNFKEMMHDFVATHLNRPASTEDFKAVVEKHMTPAMDIYGNRKMDWFFNEWVYGTELPKYDFTYTVNGDNLTFKLTQSNVSPRFAMLVPLYIEAQNGSVKRLGAATMIGNTSIEKQIPLGKGFTVKRMLINYNYDVLSQN